MVSQKLNDRFWLAEELSEHHWLNVNKDTIADINEFKSKDSSVSIRDIKTH